MPLSLNLEKLVINVLRNQLILILITNIDIGLMAINFYTKCNLICSSFMNYLNISSNTSNMSGNRSLVLILATILYTRTINMEVAKQKIKTSTELTSR